MATSTTTVTRAVESKGNSRVAAATKRPAAKAGAAKEKTSQAFPRKQLIILCNSVAAMLDAQIPLPRALEFYNARVSKPDLKQALQSVAAGVDRGDDNHKAFAATGRFDSTFIGLVKAGTMASNLSAALRAVARRHFGVGLGNRVRREQPVPARYFRPAAGPAQCLVAEL